MLFPAACVGGLDARGAAIYLSVFVLPYLVARVLGRSSPPSMQANPDSRALQEASGWSGSTLQCPLS